MKPRPVVHLELHTGDLARACAFYEDLCGWRPEQIRAGGGSYWSLGTGRGVVECDTPAPAWLPYVAVRDVVAGTERARGARRLRPARSARGAGRLAQRAVDAGGRRDRPLAAQAMSFVPDPGLYLT